MKTKETVGNIILPKTIDLDFKISEYRKKQLESIEELQKVICTLFIEKFKAPISETNLQNKIVPYSDKDSWQFSIFTTENIKFSTHQILFAVKSNSDVKFRLYKNDQKISASYPAWRKLTLQDLKKKNYIELADTEDQWISTEKLASCLEYISNFIKDHQISVEIMVQ